jgi:hypothetical protein
MVKGEQEEKREEVTVEGLSFLNSQGNYIFEAVH